jgi:NarL family two-component system sensor histidine kinase LiaS
VEKGFFRVAQEALNNVARHSRAETVEVSLRIESRVDEGHDTHSVSLIVQDDGIGFEVRESGYAGFGLRSMHDRMAALGGILEVRSRPDPFTVVTASWQTGERIRQ